MILPGYIHSWNADYTTDLAPTCDATKDTVAIAATGVHTFGPWASQGGQETHVCSVCGLVETKLLPAEQPETGDASGAPLYALGLLGALSGAVLLRRRYRKV